MNSGAGFWESYGRTQPYPHPGIPVHSLKRLLRALSYVGVFREMVSFGGTERTAEEFGNLLQQANL